MIDWLTYNVFWGGSSTGGLGTITIAIHRIVVRGCSSSSGIASRRRSYDTRGRLNGIPGSTVSTIAGVGNANGNIGTPP